VPQAKLIGLIRDPHAAMSAMGGHRVQVQVVDAVTPSEIDAAFASLLRPRVDGVIVFTLGRLRIAEAALREGMPAIALYRDFTAAGGLICYGPSMTDAYRLKGQYTGRILHGEKAAELPIVQPTKLEMTINLKTAKALGLTVPHSMLLRADEVIE
jgi:putative ABC transport system substrate-binding protein